MEFSQGELEARVFHDTVPRSSDSAARFGDTDSDDLYAEDVSGVLLGFAGVLALLVLFAVVAVVGVAMALLRHG
jgi:hypothetical protein